MSTQVIILGLKETLTQNSSKQLLIPFYFQQLFGDMDLRISGLLSEQDEISGLCAF